LSSTGLPNSPRISAHRTRRHSIETNLTELGHDRAAGLLRSAAGQFRRLNPNSTAVGVPAGCMMSLGAPLAFAAARGAILNDGMTPADLIVARYIVAGLLMLPVLLRFGIADLAGIGWRRGIFLFATGGMAFTVLQTAGLAYAPLSHGGVITPAAWRSSAPSWLR
jgi:hypothetical protein